MIKSGKIEPVKIKATHATLFEKKMEWDQANALIEKSELPWRMPTRPEAQAWSPQIREIFAGPDFIWTKTQSRKKDHFWVVNPQNGATVMYHKDCLCNVLLVDAVDQFPAKQRRWEDVEKSTLKKKVKLYRPIYLDTNRFSYGTHSKWDSNKSFFYDYDFQKIVGWQEMEVEVDE